MATPRTPLLAEVYDGGSGVAAAEAAAVLYRKPLTIPELERLLSASFGTNGALLGPLAINTALFSFIAWRGLRAQDALNLACASRGMAAAITPGVWRHFLQLERFDATIVVRDALSLVGGSGVSTSGLTLAECGGVDADDDRRAFFARRSPYHGITSVPPATWCDACDASFDGAFRSGYAGAPLGVSIAAPVDSGAAAADADAAPNEALARLSERTACPRCVARWLRPSARAERTSGGLSSGGDGGGSSTSIGSIDHAPVEATSLWSIGSSVASMVKRTLVARRSVDGAAARASTSADRSGAAIRTAYSLPNVAHDDLEAGNGSKVFEALESPGASPGASPRERWGGGGGGDGGGGDGGGAAAQGSWGGDGDPLAPRFAPRFARDGRLLATFAPLRESLSDAEVAAARATCSALVIQERWRHRGQRRKWLVARPYRVRAARVMRRRVVDLVLEQLWREGAPVCMIYCLST